MARSCAYDDSMKTEYLYGDATLSPVKVDFIALLPDAIEFAVRALTCSARIDEATEGEARFAAATTMEIEKLEALCADIVATADRTVVANGDSRVARCAAQLMQQAGALVQGEVDGARTAMANETANAKHTA